MLRIHFSFVFLICLGAVYSCSGENVIETFEKKDVQQSEQSNPSTDTTDTNDLKEIQELIREVYAWHDRGNPTHIDIMLDTIDSTYSIVNLFHLDLASEELRSSNFFTPAFISNYEDIYNAMDEMLNNRDIVWYPNELPSFGSGAHPWCNCQDVPYDEPSPWSEIEIETIQLNEISGEFYWKWGKVPEESDWGRFRYYFSVKKSGDLWKIDSLEGLNVEDMTRKHGV
jgi:hypothetical protein